MEISNEKEVEDINSRCKGKFNRIRKNKTTIRDTKVFWNTERRRKHQFEIQRQVQLNTEDEDINTRQKGKFNR